MDDPRIVKGLQVIQASMGDGAQSVAAQAPAQSGVPQSDNNRMQSDIQKYQSMPPVVQNDPNTKAHFFKRNGMTIEQAMKYLKASAGGK